MPRQKLHIKILSWFLLLCVLRVAFPIDEYIHHHSHHAPSETEICTIQNHEKCNHEEHFSFEHKEHHCLFLVIHEYTKSKTTFYTSQTRLVEKLFFTKTSSTEGFIIENYSRGPPVA